jgi:multiple sugar transport system substrate-binding protein
MRVPARYLLVTVLNLVALNSCTSDAGGGGGGATVDGDRVTISLMAEGEAEEIRAYEDIVAAFEASQDAIHVELRFAEETVDELAIAIGGGDPPDLFLINYRDYGQFAARGAVEPIEDRLASSDVLHEDDFYETAMAPFRFDGTDQMCIPQNASSLVVYYNADLFEAAGLDTPQAGWTWAEFVQDAVRMTADEDGDGTTEVYGVGVDPELIRIAPFIWSGGGQVVDDEASPTRLALDGARSSQAMQRFLDLRASYGVTPTDEEAEAVGLEERFLEGGLGMYMDSRKVVPTFRTIADFDWDVAPLPVLKDPVSILHSDAYCMTAASDERDAAWTFMEFALGPEGQAIAAATGRTVPSLRTVAESDAFLDPEAEPSNSQVYLDQIPLLRAVPNIGPWAEIEGIANDLIEEGYYAGAGATELAQEVVTQTQPLFARGEG